MKLMQELMIQRVSEAAPAARPHDRTRYKTICDLVDRDLDHMFAVFKDKDSFAELVERMGGDKGFINDIKKHLSAIEEAWSGLQMSVDMAQQDGDD